MRTAAVVLSLIAFAAFAWPTPVATPAPQSSPHVVWAGAPAATYAIESRPLGVSPDGLWRIALIAHFHDANGAVASARRGTDFDWLPARGDAQWQTRLRYGGPAAIVSVSDAGPVAVRIRANRPALGEQTVTVTPGGAAAVAGALGPHAIRVGWFPRPHGPVTIARLGRGGTRVALPAGASHWDDAGVPARTTRRYRIVADGRTLSAQARTPGDAPRTDAALYSGIGSWLVFSGDPDDADAITRMDVPRIVAAARAAHLRYVELRLAYGAFDEVTPAARAAVDRLVDGLDAAGIAAVAWTVPRSGAFDDVAATVAAAQYRTASGRRVRGLAVDLERGEEFMGGGTRGLAALSTYLPVVRAALGAHVAVMATIEDPFLERLDAATFPYHAIARAADVVQPMTYWRMLSGSYTSAAGAATAVNGSIAAVRRLSGGPVRISVGAQTTPLSRRGAPPPDELRAATAAARDAGAWGIAFYDWTGTSGTQWDALSRLVWERPGRT